MPTIRNEAKILVKSGRANRAVLPVGSAKEKLLWRCLHDGHFAEADEVVGAKKHGPNKVVDGGGQQGSEQSDPLVSALQHSVNQDGTCANPWEDSCKNCGKKSFFFAENSIKWTKSQVRFIPGLSLRIKPK